jgi:hypothetical protein
MRKCWVREKCRSWDFDGFARSQHTRTRESDFYNVVCMYIYMYVSLAGAWTVRPEVHKPCTAQSVRWCVLLCRARNWTARHVAGEGRAASPIGGEGERTLSERDRWSACYGMMEGAGSTQPVRTCTRAWILCTSGLDGFYSCSVFKRLSIIGLCPVTMNILTQGSATF